MFFNAPPILNQQKYSNSTGRPEHYPTPESSKGLLFFIQRNHNSNTVIYSVNTNLDGTINETNPMKIQWIRYEDDGELKDLSLLQEKLIYGYTSSKISKNSFEFTLDKYPDKRFFIDYRNDEYLVYCQLNGTLSVLSNIYAHADYVGTFPQLKCIELYGHSVDGQLPVIQKVLI